MTCAKSEKPRGVEARALKSRFWTLESTSKIDVERGLAPKDIFLCFFGIIWDGFWEPLGWFFGPKMCQQSMYFLSAFCF